MPDMKDPVTEDRLRSVKASLLKSISALTARLLGRTQAEHLKLPGPVRVQIAKALDIDTAGQASFDGCSVELWSEKSDRER
jgi:hypothetical protein